MLIKLRSFCVQSYQKFRVLCSSPRQDTNKTRRGEKAAATPLSPPPIAAHGDS